MNSTLKTDYPTMQALFSDQLQLVTTLFDQHVTEHPSRVAVLFEDRSLTYAELDQLSNQIANVLVELKLPDESCVGLCLDRSDTAIAAMLGVMKAGLAFVPLDPDFPASRLAYMVEDASIRHCITQSTYTSLLENLPTTLHMIESAFLDADSRPAGIAIRNSQLAYVMYTSGSTGNPKGVQIEHEALANYCLADASVYELTQSDVTLQFSTLNFDIAIEEIFPPLITGSTIAVRPQQRDDDLNELSALIKRFDVTAIHVATAYWHEWVNLLDATNDSTPDTIRLMIVTGEKVSTEHYRTWRSLTHHEVLWANAYGPTETTVTATVFVPPSDWSEENLPIGKPLEGYTAKILDADFNPVEDRETGELYIGGPSLARGYLNRPDLTEAVFITLPSGERIYKTGDLARWMDTGDIEYAGRIDHQIKMGSFRIEPGEIEESLNKHPDVFEALVIATDNVKSGGRQIIAYLGCSKSLTAAELHQSIANELPVYMLPAGYLLLDKLPKTLNGKIDRDNLPAPELAEVPRSANFVEPVTDMEKAVAAVWSGVLGRTQLSAADDFFDIGGNSLKVTQCITRLHQSLGKSPTARDFYANPTIAHLSELLEQQSAQSSRPAISSLSEGDLVELTDNQYQVWFQQKLVPDLSIYNIYEAFDINGALDIALLDRSLQMALLRHPVLNVQFEEDDGRCFQRYTKPDPSIKCLNVIHDLSASPDDWTHEQIHLGFNLPGDKPYRFALLQFAEQSYRLVLTVHHLIADGWSMTLLTRDIGEYYNNALNNNLQEITSDGSFFDFAAYTRSNRNSPERQDQLDYWTTRLQSLEPVELAQATALTGDRNFSANEVRFDIAIRKETLQSNSELNSVTPFMLLLGTFKLLLHRYSQAERVAVAVAHSGRSISGVEETFGLFVNTLIACTEVNPEDNTSGFLERVRKTTLEAFANQDASLAELVAAIRPERHGQTMPFTPFLFLMQDIPDTDLKLSGLDTKACNTPAVNIDYDILLELTEQPDNPDAPYTARLVYSDELYQHSDMQHMAGHYQNLLSSMLAMRETSVAELPFLGSCEEELLLHKLNDTFLDYPSNSSVCEEIWKIASDHPDRTAVRFESTSLTYSELTGRVSTLSNHLQSLGAVPNALVAVFMERSADMLIALLAIQHSGAAYLPMDPLYPEDRISFIMSDAQAPILITENALLNAVPDIQARIVCLDRDWPDIEKNQIFSDRSQSETAVATANDLAYVIYTSGSTGKPKGVKLTRRNVVNFLYAMREKPGITADDTLIAVTTISFDIAVLELYLPLICCACVDIVSRETAINGRALATRLTEVSASIMQATPATWRLLLETDWQPQIGFKALIGGEALPQELIDPLISRVDELWNMYGPTETTVWSTCARITNAAEIPSIGTPIANTQIYILTRGDQLAPLSIPGELCIGGDGVSAGYANRDDLTTEKFFSNPWVDQGRIYRTGDSARWLPDGSLEFLGRLDNQIKLRGYRIEPGEIEKAICTIDNIEQAVVKISALPQGEFLTAYLVSDNEPSQQSIRDHLANSLPDYMIPSLWVSLDELPLTPNGKIDRKALPSPESISTPTSESNPPVTETEKTIAAMWSELLTGTSPQREDNFFALGGHSLIAMRFIAKAEDTFGTPLPVRSLMTDSLARVALRLNPDDLSDDAHDALKTSDNITTAFLHSDQSSLYTVLHQPPVESSAGNAILICQPIGHEYLRMHKCIQRLACELAKAGNTVLRFDYRGTGDSSGELGGSRLHHWQQDVRRAAMHLKSIAKVNNISLIGVRLGASIMMSSRLEPFDQTILWDPVTSGSDWVKHQRHLHHHEMANLDRYRWVQRRSDPFETVGYQYSENLIRDINHLELGTTATQLNQRTLIISSSDQALDELLSDDFEHSLTDQCIVTMDDGQRWHDETSVDHMILGYGAIRLIRDSFS